MSEKRITDKSTGEDTSVMAKPKKIWNDALKMVKGEDSTQLIESFTAEMTLVAEGLCEDQNRLRGEVNEMIQSVSDLIYCVIHYILTLFYFF